MKIMYAQWRYGLITIATMACSISSTLIAMEKVEVSTTLQQFKALQQWQQSVARTIWHHPAANLTGVIEPRTPELFKPEREKGKAIPAQKYIAQYLDKENPETLTIALHKIVLHIQPKNWPMAMHDINSKMQWPNPEIMPLNDHDIQAINAALEAIQLLNFQSTTNDINALFNTIIALRVPQSIWLILLQRVADKIGEKLDNVVWRCPTCNTLTILFKGKQRPTKCSKEGCPQTIPPITPPAINS